MVENLRFGDIIPDLSTQNREKEERNVPERVVKFLEDHGIELSRLSLPKDNEMYIDDIEIQNLERFMEMSDAEIEDFARKELDEFLEKRKESIVKSYDTNSSPEEIMTYLRQVDEELIQLCKDTPGLSSLFKLILPTRSGGTKSMFFVGAGNKEGLWLAAREMEDRLGEEHEVYIIARLAILKEQAALIQGELKPEYRALDDVLGKCIVKLIKEIQFVDANKKLVAELKLQAPVDFMDEFRETEEYWDMQWEEPDAEVENEGEMGIPFEDFVAQVKKKEYLSEGSEEVFAEKKAEKDAKESADGLSQFVRSLFANAARFGKRIEEMPYSLEEVLILALGEKDKKLPITLESKYY